MGQILQINDIVVVTLEDIDYEGVLLQINGDKVLVYCAEFNATEPYVVTYVSNVKRADCQETGKKLVN